MGSPLPYSIREGADVWKRGAGGAGDNQVIFIGWCARRAKASVGKPHGQNVGNRGTNAMSLDEHYTIDTPEHIELSYTVAGIGSRFLAAIIDTFLLLLIQLLLIAAMFLIIHGVDGIEQTDAVTSIVLAIWGIMSFLFFWGYYILFELAWNGQSPGKRLIRLRVVRDHGRPITFAASAIRNLIRVIDFLPSLYGVGVLVMFVDRHARRLGDMAAGTLVVKEDAAVTLDKLVSRATTNSAPPPHPSPTPADPLATIALDQQTEPSEPFVPTIPNLTLVKQSDYDLVQEFLRRRTELGKESRQTLGTQLAEKLLQRLGITIESSHSHERFLEHLAEEYRQLVRE